MGCIGICNLKKIHISYRDEFSRCCQKAEVRPVVDEPHYNCITQADRRLTSQDRFCPAREEKKGEGEEKGQPVIYRYYERMWAHLEIY